MTSFGIRLSSFVLLASLFGLAQTPVTQNPGTATPASPAVQSPETAPGNQNQAPHTVAPPAKPGAETQAPATKPSTDATPAAHRDRAQAYYHFALAHMYEEMVSMYGHSEYASKAIDEYKLALQNDPGSEELNAGLAELYFKTGHIRDAVTESQDIIKRDPNNLDARKLLGRIYLRSLGDIQGGGAQSSEILKLAIDQFSQIVRLEPDNVDDHLLLGRLYIISKDYLKAEGEFKAARQVQPDSEEAVVNLAYLYNEEGDNKKAVDVLQSLPEGQRSGKLYAVLGYTFEQQKEYKQAIDAYKHAIDI